MTRWERLERREDPHLLVRAVPEEVGPIQCLRTSMEFPRPRIGSRTEELDRGRDVRPAVIIRIIGQADGEIACGRMADVKAEDHAAEVGATVPRENRSDQHAPASGWRPAWIAPAAWRRG